MSRLVLDNDQNLDENNIYLPETQDISPSSSSVTIDFNTLSYPFTLSSSAYFGYTKASLPNSNTDFIPNNNVSSLNRTYESPVLLCAAIKSAWDLLVGNYFYIVNNLDGTLTIKSFDNTDSYNNHYFVLSENNGTTIILSNQLSGGFDGITSVTNSLSPINKSRKSYFLNDTLFLRGFCGFAGLHTIPLDKSSQSNFFSIEDNKCVIDSQNGIGFEHKLANIEDNTYYLAVALKLNSLNNVSNVLTEHLAFKITRSGNNLLVSLVEITAKTVSDGWVFSNEIPIIKLSDSFEYSQNDSISFIYPNANPSAIQFLMKDSLGFVKKVKTFTTGYNFDAIVSKVSNNTFALFHVFANTGANADITVIKSLSK